MERETGADAHLSAMRVSAEAPFDTELCCGDEDGWFMGEQDSIMIILKIELVRVNFCVSF